MQKQSVFYGLAACSLLLLLGVYWNHFENDFQFDDAHTIENNNAIRSLKNIPSFFVDAKTTSSVPANQVYRPGLTTLNAIDLWLGGEQYPIPKVFHRSIFICYVLLGVLLYFLFLKLFNESVEHKWNKYFALFGAAFFSMHAANAETVNYIIARSDSFSTLMIVLSLIIYLYKPSWRKKCIYLIPILIGFFVKEPTIMIAPLLLIYILLYVKTLPILKWFSINGIKEGVSAAFTLIPLFILAALLFMLSKSMISSTYTPGGASRYEYILSQPFVIVHYFNNFLIPLNLSADTDWMPIANIFDDRVLIGSLFIFSMVAIAMYCSTKKTLYPIAFGISWFFLALLPTSVVPLAEVLNDHRTFFPYIGLVIAVAWLVGLTAIRYQKSIEEKIQVKFLFFILPILLISGHAYGTHERNKVWHSGETLWLDVTQKSPNNGRGLMNYGLAKMSKGDYSTALNYFERALKILPNYSYLYVNMGVLKSAMGNQTDAEINFKQALFLNPENPEPYYFYAKWLYEQGRFREALDKTTAGLKVSPGHSGNKSLYANLTAIVANKGGSQLQISEQVAKEKPNVNNCISLSLVYYQEQQYEKCIEAANEAIKINPNCVEAYNNICAAYNMLKMWDKAIDAGEKGLKVNPDYPLIKNNLEMSKKGRAGN